MDAFREPFSTRRYLAESLDALTAFNGDTALLGLLEEMSQAVCQSLRVGGKLLIAGNGGSAADAQHIAAEFTSRLMYDRAPLAGLALDAPLSINR